MYVNTSFCCSVIIESLKDLLFHSISFMILSEFSSFAPNSTTIMANVLIMFT